MGMTEQEAIEELKCYRACSGTQLPEEMELAIKALEEVQQYKVLGGTPELIAKVINFLGNDEDNSVINDLELLNQYIVLGTVEELSEAKGKQIAKKPILSKSMMTKKEFQICPICERLVLYDGIKFNYCQYCGQKLEWDSIDWGNEDETN